MNQEEFVQIVRAPNRARKYVLVQQGKSPNDGVAYWNRPWPKF